MDRRFAMGAIALGVVLAAILAVGMSPDTGGDLPTPAPLPPPVAAAVPAPPPPSPAPAPRPLRQEDPEAPEEDVWSTMPPPIPGSLVRKIGPRPPFDPDKVYDVEERGIATALFDRQPRLVSCYAEHKATYGPVDGRPIVRATVLPEPDDNGDRVQIHMENRGTALDELDLCLSAAMADANFGDIDVPTTVLQPIPLPKGF